MSDWNLWARRIRLAFLALTLGASVAAAEEFFEMNEMIQRLQRGETIDLFPGANTRAGVFTFEDPDLTGIGDSASFLIANSMLFSSHVGSFAVVGFQDSAGKDETTGLSYFDKVDALTRNQNFLLSLWGQVSRDGDTVSIDTFAQLGLSEQNDRFARSVQLPEAMGGDSLIVRVKPDRFKLQSLSFGASDVERLIDAAKDVGGLRETPDASSAVFAQIEPGRSYHMGSPGGDWVLLRPADGGKPGWTSVAVFCVDVCARLTDNADYASELFATLQGNSSAIPSSLTREALAVWEQSQALPDFDRSNPEHSLEVAERWVGPPKVPRTRLTPEVPNRGIDPVTGIDRSGPPPGGAAFANLRAVAMIAIALKNAPNPTGFDTIKLDRDLVADIAADLAAASVADPKNLEVLQNLAVLFGYLGDDKRRALALRITKSILAAEKAL